MVVVGEDCALTSSDKTAGRRGLCGTVFIHKVKEFLLLFTNHCKFCVKSLSFYVLNICQIAGAMAEKKEPLEKIAEFCRFVATQMGRINKLKYLVYIVSNVCCECFRHYRSESLTLCHSRFESVVFVGF